LTPRVTYQREFEAIQCSQRVEAALRYGGFPFVLHVIRDRDERRIVALDDFHIRELTAPEVNDLYELITGRAGNY
jgi:hypothetical protein